MANRQAQPQEPEIWTAPGFLREFKRIHDTMEDRAFVFVLGAGASVSSKIKPGAALAKDWIEDIYHLKGGAESKISLEEWATAENLDIPNFDWGKYPSFYPQIYERRFGDDPESGYAYLENVMEKAEPNVGYSVLAQVLAKTRHKTIITTNFDNLVADALSLYTETFPLVCGHESLAGFVRPKLRRPLVAKIHRDLLLAPKNDVQGTSQLGDGWAAVLKRLLEEFTPIVIGYGGNDGSLMGFLDNLSPGEIRGGIFWCYRLADGSPNAEIKKVVAKHKGKLIPIVGFDEFMIQLGDVLGYELLDQKLEQQAKKRAERYREQFNQFQKNLEQKNTSVELDLPLSQVREAFAQTVKKENSWWGWELKVQEEKDPVRQEQLYRDGLREFPDSAELTGNFANFMKNIRKDYNEAEVLYRKALELNPGDAIHTGNYAVFLTCIRKDYDQAEAFYRKALELDPANAIHMGNFASFMQNIRKSYDQAEALFRKALELDSGNALHTGNFAIFLNDIRKNHDQAEVFFIKGLELAPDDANHIGNFTKLRIEQRRFDQALTLFKQSFELNQREAAQIDKVLQLELWFYAYAVFFNEFADAAQQMETLLADGIRSPEWHLQEVVNVARELGHPDIERLCRFEQQITQSE